MFINNPYKILKLNRFLRGHVLKCMAVLAADFLKLRYMSIRADPYFGCNLRCAMCHYSSKERRTQKRVPMPIDDFERIARIFFKKSIQVILGCGSEPTMHPSLPKLVEIAKKGYHVPFVGIATNGQLLTRSLVMNLLKNGLDEIMISIHGVTKETYERLQPPASYEKLHGILSLLTQISLEENIAFKLRVNYTVNPDNYAELSDFFTVFGKYKIDILQIRIIFDLGETEYTNKNLVPYYVPLFQLCADLKEQCLKRKTILLSPSFEESDNEESSSAIVLPLVLRYASPNIVWKEDFDWRNETYEAYCRRTGWHKSIVKMIFMRKQEILKNIKHARRSLGYDVSI